MSTRNERLGELAEKIANDLGNLYGLLKRPSTGEAQQQVAEQADKALTDQAMKHHKKDVLQYSTMAGGLGAFLASRGRNFKALGPLKRMGEIGGGATVGAGSTAVFTSNLFEPELVQREKWRQQREDRAQPAKEAAEKDHYAKLGEFPPWDPNISPEELAEWQAGARSKFRAYMPTGLGAVIGGTIGAAKDFNGYGFKNSIGGTAIGAGLGLAGGIAGEAGRNMTESPTTRAVASGGAVGAGLGALASLVTKNKLKAFTAIGAGGGGLTTAMSQLLHGEPGDPLWR